ncbi:unnamed protein product [Amoebophrya sp. A25]|nr:unnamed protein product [Amoebophrya sp. A25]|eukprot:GSA25T00015642001.1
MPSEGSKKLSTPSSHTPGLSEDSDQLRSGERRASMGGRSSESSEEEEEEKGDVIEEEVEDEDASPFLGYSPRTLQRHSAHIHYAAALSPTAVGRKFVRDEIEGAQSPEQRPSKKDKSKSPGRRQRSTSKVKSPAKNSKSKSPAAEDAGAGSAAEKNTLSTVSTGLNAESSFLSHELPSRSSLEGASRVLPPLSGRMLPHSANPAGLELFVTQPASSFIQPVSQSRLKLMQSFEDFQADRAYDLHTKTILDVWKAGNCRAVEQKMMAEGRVPWHKPISSCYVPKPAKLNHAYLTSQSWILGRSGNRSLSPTQQYSQVRGFGGPYGMWYQDREAGKKDADRPRRKLLAASYGARDTDAAAQAAQQRMVRTGKGLLLSSSGEGFPEAATTSTSLVRTAAESALRSKRITISPSSTVYSTQELSPRGRAIQGTVLDDLITPDKGTMSPLQKIRPPLPEMYSFRDPEDRPMLVNPAHETLANIGDGMPILTQDNIDMKYIRDRCKANVDRNHEIIRDTQRTDKREQRVLRLYTDVIKRVNRDEAAEGQRKDRFGMMGETRRKQVLESSKAAQGSIRKNLSAATQQLEASVKEIERIKRREELAHKKLQKKDSAKEKDNDGADAENENGEGGGLMKMMALFG